MQLIIDYALRKDLNQHCKPCSCMRYFSVPAKNSLCNRHGSRAMKNDVCGVNERSSPLWLIYLISLKLKILSNRFRTESTKKTAVWNRKIFHWSNCFQRNNCIFLRGCNINT